MVMRINRHITVNVLFIVLLTMTGSADVGSNVPPLVTATAKLPGAVVGAIFSPEGPIKPNSPC